MTRERGRTPRPRGGTGPVPAIAVVVPAHGRPLRLRWLLVALAEQTLDPGSLEAVVVHDGTDAEIARAIADAGVREVRVAPGTGRPAVQRNAGWQAARAPLVAFTDDDCRPAEDWLERLLAAAQAAPGAVVQGAVRPDPDERRVLHHAPHTRTLLVDPPTPWGQTANIAYPRALLERLGGFDEAFPAPAGEDTDLLQRALAAGAVHVAAPDAVVFHAVEALTLPSAARGRWRWQHVPEVVRRHPHLREPMPLRVFWKPRHAYLVLALAAATTLPAPAALLAALPYARDALPSYGAGKRGRLRAAAELPARALLDLVELAAVARGAVRARTVLL